MRLVLTPDQYPDLAHSFTNLGGKAANLIRMQQAGLPVPPFLILPCEAVGRLLKPAQKAIDIALHGVENLPDRELIRRAADIQQRIRALPFPSDMERELRDSCRWYFGESFMVAVRSSAAAEDGGTSSFAGQHASFLFVDADSLIEKLKETIASAWNAGALKYRLLHGLSLQRIEIAVVIQQMVDADRSGVSFSKNLNGNLADMALVAGFGLGEGIVGDKVETDAYIVNLQHRTVGKTILPKYTALVHIPGSGCIPEPLPEARRHTAVLQDEEIFQVCAYTATAESLLGAPADVEFSFDRGGRLFILQMRPVTTLDPAQVKILDNTNIVESYPGVTLPLSFSFAAAAYEKVFRNSARLFLLPAGKTRHLSGVFPHLLAHYCGRVYYRLDNWYRMMALIHSSQRSVRAWEKAVGLAHGESEKLSFSLWNKLRTTLVSAWLILNYRRGNAAFFRQFAKNYGLLRNYRAFCSSPAELWKYYEQVTAALFRPWPQTLINDFLAFRAFGWLQDLVRKFGVDEREDFANELLCGRGGVESEEAVLQMLELKAAVLDDPELHALFAQPAGDVLSKLAGPRYRLFADRFSAYLDRYGDRTLAELKLETPSLRRSPEQFVRLLQSQLRSPGTAAGFRQKQAQIRRQAEDRVRARLKEWDPRRILFRAVWALAAYGLKSRENMRFCRTRAYGAVKDIFLEIGGMMVQAGVLEMPEDVFYLNLDMLRRFCSGEDCAPKQNIVHERRERFGSYALLDLPDRVMYTGEAPPEFREAVNAMPRAGVALLQGIPVSKGLLRAEAVVLSEPELDADVQGKILVTAITDPGWVFLMARAGGLVSEKGSLLSHTAIVGRELGIPVVVGVAGATTRIKTGDVVALDGGAGTVEVLNFGF